MAAVRGRPDPVSPRLAPRHGSPAPGDGELPYRGRFGVAVSARSRGWEEAEPLVPVLEVKAFCFRKRQSSQKKNKLANKGSASPHSVFAVGLAVRVIYTE